MANEVMYRADAVSLTLKFTIRSADGLMWATDGTPNFEALNHTRWANYIIALPESSAGNSYFYTGTWPSPGTYANMVPGWYHVDVFNGTTIGSTLLDKQFGYWDGTTFNLGASDVRQIAGSTPAATAVSAVFTNTGGVPIKATTLTLTDGLVISRSTAGGVGVSISGSTTGAGMAVAGGNAGNGVTITGNGAGVGLDISAAARAVSCVSSATTGMYIGGTGSSQAALTLNGASNAHGIYAVGSGSGISAVGVTDGIAASGSVGLRATGHFDSGILATGYGTDNAGIESVGVSSASGIRAYGAVIGLYVKGVADSGIYAEGDGSSNAAFELLGTSAAPGMLVRGNGTGAGIDITGGTTGDGIRIGSASVPASLSGVPINIISGVIAKPGVSIIGLGSGAGIEVAGGTIGDGIRIGSNGTAFPLGGVALNIKSNVTNLGAVTLTGNGTGKAVAIVAGTAGTGIDISESSGTTSNFGIKVTSAGKGISVGSAYQALQLIGGGASVPSGGTTGVDILGGMSNPGIKILGGFGGQGVWIGADSSNALYTANRHGVEIYVGSSSTSGHGVKIQGKYQGVLVCGGNASDPSDSAGHAVYLVAGSGTAHGLWSKGGSSGTGARFESAYQGIMVLGGGATAPTSYYGTGVYISGKDVSSTAGAGLAITNQSSNSGAAAVRIWGGNAAAPTNGTAIDISGGGSGYSGISVTGSTTANGVSISGGGGTITGAGHGMEIAGGAASGNGIGILVKGASNSQGMAIMGSGASHTSQGTMGVEIVGSSYGLSCTASAGPGQKNEGTTYGMWNIASSGAGMTNTGTTFGMSNAASAGPGQKNEGTTYGMWNIASGLTAPGMKNEGTGPGMYNYGVSQGTYNYAGSLGGIGAFNQSMSGPGMKNEGTTYGMWNTTLTAASGVGQLNEALGTSGIALKNTGISNGMYNYASGGFGQYNYGSTAGMYNNASAGPGMHNASVGGNGAGIENTANGTGKDIKLSGSGTIESVSGNVIQIGADLALDAYDSNGGVAKEASVSSVLTAVQNVQNSTFISANIPGVLERPDTGHKDITITVLFTDETGTPHDLDRGTLVVTLTSQDGTDLSSRVGVWTRAALGKYTATYVNSSTDALDYCQWEIECTVNTKARRYVASTQIVDTTAVDFTSTDRLNLGSILLATDTGAAPGAVGGLATYNMQLGMMTLQEVGSLLVTGTLADSTPYGVVLYPRTIGQAGGVKWYDESDTYSLSYSSGGSTGTWAVRHETWSKLVVTINSSNVFSTDRTETNGTVSSIVAVGAKATVNAALVAQKLDHLVAVADNDDVVDNSIIAKLASKSATADWSTFDNTAASLEAVAEADVAAALTPQQVRDAMKLAPSALPEPAAGSVDLVLTTVAADVVGLDGTTADAIGTDAAGKVLVTPSQKIKTNADGQVETSNPSDPPITTEQSTIVTESSVELDDVNILTEQTITIES